MNRPEAIDQQKLTTALTPVMTPLSHVVDGIQDLLEGVYGLSDLRLQRASRYLWPRKPSTVLAHNFEIGDAGGTNFSTDWDVPVGAWKEEGWLGTDWYRQFDRERRVIRFNLRRLIQGGFRFQDLHPALFVAPEHAEQTQRITSLDEMLSEQRVVSLELITMGVSMFLNTNTQYLLYREMPGRNTGYGMTLVDFYHVATESNRKADINTSDKGNANTGRLELMKTLFGRQGLEQRAFEKAVEAYKEGKLYYNPLAGHYTESADAFEGLIYHLIDAFNSGVNLDPVLKRFYRLRGVDKRDFLRDLYNKKAEAGDEKYAKSARQLNRSYPPDDYKWGYVDHRYEGL